MTEADYICFIAKDITRGLFQNGGFYVVPEPTNHPMGVYFPDLNYSNKFWSLISKCKACDLGAKFPKIAVDEVNSKIKAKKSKQITYKGIKFELLETKYGTVGSFNKYIMTNRIGNSKQEFEKTFALMNLLLKNKDRGEIGDIVWHKRNAVIEYLFGKFKSKQSIELEKISQEYLEKLGFKQEEIKININNPIFTKQEKDVLGVLIRNTGQIVSFDDLADIIWKDKSDQKFSLEAIAKIIQNIRIKIRTLGINKEIIFTKRGSGYLYIQ
ncbi:MAG: helix-turn-helix domain-containing protein [Microgenomates group bacterium]